MNKNHLFIPALMLALTSQAPAADLIKTDSSLKPKLKAAPATTVKVPQQKLAVEPSAQVKNPEGGDNKLPAVQKTPGLNGIQADRAARAATANQARQMNDVKDLNGMQDIRNMGDVKNLDGQIGGSRPGQGGRFGMPDPGSAPGAKGNSPYQRPAGFNDPMDGHRNSDKKPGMPAGIRASNPRDAAGGLASQQGGGNVTHSSSNHGGLVTYTKTVHHSGGGYTQHNATYYRDTGEFHSGYSRTADNQGNTTSTRTLEVVQRRTNSETGETTIVVREERTESDGGSSVHPGRELGGDKGDPPPRDPNRIAGYQPAEGMGGAGGCDMSLYWCQREAELGRQFRKSPDRVNPGDPDNSNQPAGPRLTVDPETLVTNPAKTRGGGFVPSDAWAQHQREKLQQGPGPGARPPGK